MATQTSETRITASDVLSGIDHETVTTMALRLARESTHSMGEGHRWDEGVVMRAIASTIRVMEAAVSDSIAALGSESTPAT